jgi:hypothetical protein
MKHFNHVLKRQHTGDVETLIVRLARFVLPLAKIVGGTVIGVAAFAAAWHALGLPVPASTGYVDVALEKKITLLTERINAVNTTAMQTRLETLFSTRNRDQGELSELDLRLKTASPQTDANYISLIKLRQRELTDEVDRLNRQISAVQSTINENTLTEGSEPPR